jgi:hypothetical protein
LTFLAQRFPALGAGCDGADAQSAFRLRRRAQHRRRINRIWRKR